MNEEGGGSHFPHLRRASIKASLLLLTAFVRGVSRAFTTPPRILRLWTDLTVVRCRGPSAKWRLRLLTQTAMLPLCSKIEYLKDMGKKTAWQ